MLNNFENTKIITKEKKHKIFEKQFLNKVNIVLSHFF